MRRREPVRREADRPKPPNWITNRVAGLVHVGGRDDAGDLVLGDGVCAELQSARDEWCLTKGCWRPGAKTCIEATGRQCDAAAENARL